MTKAITAEELAAASRIPYRQPIAAETLESWLVSEKLARRSRGGRLTPTAKAVELGESLSPLAGSEGEGTGRAEARERSKLASRR